MKRCIGIFEDLFLGQKIQKEEMEALSHLAERYPFFLRSEKTFSDLPKNILVVKEIPDETKIIFWISRISHKEKDPVVLVGRKNWGRNEVVPSIKEIQKFL